MMVRETRAPTNMDVVTYALAQLDGAKKAVHLEHIAVKAHELAPGSFRWDLDEYAERTDKDKVRVSLTDAEKPDKGSLVEAVGVSKRAQSKRTDRWRLTAAGVVWVQAQQARLELAFGQPTPALKRGKADSLRRRLAASPLHAEFTQRDAVTADPYAFTDLLECSPDASNAVVARRFDELEAQTRLLNDDQLLEFLRVCGHAHSDMLDKG